MSTPKFQKKLLPNGATVIGYDPRTGLFTMLCPNDHRNEGVTKRRKESTAPFKCAHCPKPQPAPRQCLVCKTTFIPKMKTHVRCSRECHRKRSQRAQGQVPVIKIQAGANSIRKTQATLQRATASLSADRQQYVDTYVMRHELACKAMGVPVEADKTRAEALHLVSLPHADMRELWAELLPQKHKRVELSRGYGHIYNSGEQSRDSW